MLLSGIELRDEFLARYGVCCHGHAALLAGLLMGVREMTQHDYEQTYTLAYEMVMGHTPPLGYNDPRQAGVTFEEGLSPLRNVLGAVLEFDFELCRDLLREDQGLLATMAFGISLIGSESERESEALLQRFIGGDENAVRLVPVRLVQLFGFLRCSGTTDADDEL